MPELNVKKLLNNEEVKALSNSNLAYDLEQLEITPEWLLNQHKNVIKEARKNKQHNTQLRAIEGLEELSGMKDTIKIKHKQTQKNDNFTDIREIIATVKQERTAQITTPPNKE